MARSQFYKVNYSSCAWGEGILFYSTSGGPQSMLNLGLDDCE